MQFFHIEINRFPEMDPLTICGFWFKNLYKALKSSIGFGQ